jgi:hypothetical protein
MIHHGQNNSGPATQVWATGDRVLHAVRGRDYGAQGRVAQPRRERGANETNHVWVQWDDGQSGYVDPGNLDRA